jgi:hypothetical protein
MAMNSWQVGVAAEAIAAGLFARCGCNVSVQYGANQPEYDLLVDRSGRILRVSVKGSSDGKWGLTQSYLPKGSADYQEAIRLWKRAHSSDIVFCFVQFDGVDLASLPRVYLATRDKVARRLSSTARHRGSTVLYEGKVWSKRAYGAGTTDKIPRSWRFSEEEVSQLFAGRLKRRRN